MKEVLFYENQNPQSSLQNDGLHGKSRTAFGSEQRHEHVLLLVLPAGCSGGTLVRERACPFVCRARDTLVA